MNKRRFLFINITLTNIRIILLIVGAFFLNRYILDNGAGGSSTTMYVAFISVFVVSWILIMVLNLTQTIMDIKNNILNVGMWVISLSFENFELLKYKDKFESNFIHNSNWSSIREIILTSIFLALFWIFSTINMFIPNLPIGVSISVKFIPLFAATIFLRFRYALILGIIAGVSSLMFGPTVIAFGQWLLEYFLVLLVPCIGALFKVDGNSKINNLNTTILICTIPWILIFIFRVMASTIYWFEYAWEGYNIVLFSIIFNIPNLLTDYIVTLLMVPVFLKLNQHIKFN